MRLFDSHAHYDDARFDGCREQLIGDSFASGVEYILNAASDLSTARASIALSGLYPQFYAAAGIHPHECESVTDEAAALSELERLLSCEKVVALGEIGLDYYYDKAFKEKQLHWFDLQLSLAQRLSLPVIVHDRDAHGDTMDMLAAHPGAMGILHSFSGSVEMLRELVRRGWYISFSGVVTFKNASRILDCVRAVPDELLLVETDCPYLAPVPMRGKTNCSAYLPYTVAAIAAARGSTPDEIAETTFRNALRVYGIH